VTPPELKGHPTHVGSITITVDEYVATVTLDRPPVNALTRQTWREIHDGFDSLNERKDVRAALFTAAGDRAFCAGVDLKADRTPTQPTATEITDTGRLVREALWAVYECAVPVVAAVNGPAIGGGCALVAMCDIVVAAETAAFGMTEINVGVLGGISHLSRLVGARKARELYFTGELLSARELHALGAARAVVPRAELLPAAREVARLLATKSPVAMRLAKEAANRVDSMPIKSAYRTEQDYTSRLRTYADAEEARLAYLERREPNYRFS
jgi:enoyl-CoA hydratase